MDAQRVNRLAAAQEALLRALARHGVDLVVVGGVAAQLHGWRGATVDLDIAVSIDESNVRRLNRALVEVGAGPGLPGALGTVLDHVRAAGDRPRRGGHRRLRRLVAACRSPRPR